MKKVLILGGSQLQLPMIKKAKELNYIVGVVDYDKNAVGKKYADFFYEVSTNDIDSVKKIAKEFNPDGITTLATDMPVRTIASVSKYLNKNNSIKTETSVKCTDKFQMIESFHENKVPSPWFFKVSEKDYKNNQYEFPCIVKPIDSSGSKGVNLVHHFNDLEDAIKYATKYSKLSEVIIEEYLIGPEVSVEIIVDNNEVNVINITNKTTTGEPNFVELMHMQPAQLSKENIIKVKETAIKAVKAVGINFGPAHVEMIITKDGPKLVELGARLGGDFITTHLIKYSTGIDLVEATLRQSCGESIDIVKKIDKVSVIKFFHPTKIGILENIQVPKDIYDEKGVKDVFIFKKSGCKIEKLENSNNRLGAVISQSDSYSEAIKICEDAISKIKISVK